VQPLPSSQPVPLAAFVGVGHVPVDGLHVPATLQVGAVHVIVGPGAHVPLWQLSFTVQPLPSLQAIPFATGAQVPVAVAQLVQPPHAAPAFCHMPLGSHICGCRPLHCLVPEVHAAQVPALHTFVQAVPVFCQTPFGSHVCGCRFMQPFMPGVQLPVQVPVAFTQTNAQAVPVSTQALPVASQVWG